jgi:hypothetical protein
MIRVELPHHLRNLAQVGREVTVEVDVPVTLRRVLDELEARYPVLRGTIRDHDTQQCRPFLRFFACQEDLSHESPDDPLPEAVATGKEPLLVVGAIAGGNQSSSQPAAPFPASGVSPTGRQIRKSEKRELCPQLR